jgi:hypothetical protein
MRDTAVCAHNLAANQASVKLDAALCLTCLLTLKCMDEDSTIICCECGSLKTKDGVRSARNSPR